MKVLNGVHLNHNKNTENESTVIFPLPQSVTIPMAQGMSAPCEPLVAVGDEVLVGQKIGESEQYLSIPIHTGVSGKVTAIKDYSMPNGRTCKAVVIESDGKQTTSPDIQPPKYKTREEFIKAVRESGACGLGGAGFPTFVKFSFKPEITPIDTLVVNAAECEPYITSDYRELMERPKDVYEGILLIMKELDIPYAKLCIENNKPKAIKLLTEMASKNKKIDVVTLPSKYPQGAEKMLVYSATGKIIKEGELPSHQGALVMNVSTVAFLYRYFQTGMPLISRRLTVDGDAVGMPCNVEVLLGTTIGDILEYANVKDYTKLLMGGPMMGMGMFDTNAPIIKTHNALLALRAEPRKAPTACIRCGACVRACPMNLMPESLEKAFDAKNVDALVELKLGLCMNCGCCTYVCPANRALAEKNQLAKALLPRK